MADAVSGDMVVSGECLTVPLGTLNGFLEFVDRMHTAMVEGRTTDLPARPAPKIKCEDCDYYMACTRCRISVGGGDSDE